MLERHTVSDLFKHQGERVVFGQRLMQASSDTFLGAAISGYLGRSKAFDKAMGSFAVAYAEQNESDHEAFAAAAEEGAMEVERGI